jgi:hypothetical protein
LPIKRTNYSEVRSPARDDEPFNNAHEEIFFGYHNDNEYQYQ